MDHSTEPAILSFPKINDPRGNLTFLQHPDHLPFKMERAFWTYDVPGGDTRGGHAYHQQREIIIALSGSFDVVVTKPDGTQVRYPLNRSYYGLYLPSLTWRHMENFSTNALGLHLSNMVYSAEDYIRDFNEFKKLHENNNRI
ncbi:FdtA/QdtA family cupin domain-containing protein [Fulvivirgaceae bacterium PWU4]|uniref:FdtA/QdtA family cupin domain-containing protein n=1 Tax=Chryseosolibacter histidini TaxID=2782349 RepID=A0AAP2GLV8_9BACT|nr:FdtA/QdtA family cupin domain-containing protein [Chryseosolibacter histidini]MBT1700539.1 FdtA/QdtA family cupin domain-containing protein [Chryseosolibacter histidini]